MIQSRPASPAEPLQAGTRIRGGSFSIPRHEGPTPGDDRAIINGDEERSAAEAKGEAIPPLARDRIPLQYNTKATLTVRVATGEANAFALKTK